MNTGFPQRRSPLVIEGPPASGTMENPAIEQLNRNML